MLAPQDHQHIRSYKYTGGDSSPLYAHVLSPWAQFCVDNFVPSYVAPNVITVAGLVLSFLATTIALIVNPALGTDAPRWSHLVVGICVFLYQTLDNMDGKQARKTGSSSALGMLIDHGCDALNSGITTIGMASVLGLGWTQRLVFVYWSSMVLFYFQTWEEYYSGHMILPPFNGASEGLTMCEIVSLLAFFKGSAWFHEGFYPLPTWLYPYLPSAHSLLSDLGLPSAPTAAHPTPSLTPFSVMFLIVLVCNVYTCILDTYRVCRKFGEKMNQSQINHVDHGEEVKDSQSHSQNQTITQPSASSSMSIDPLFTLLPLIVFFSGLIYLVQHSTVWFTVPISTVTFFACTFAEMNVHIMLGTICKKPLKPLERYSVFILVVLCIITGSSSVFVLQLEKTLIVLGAAYSAISFWTLLSNVCLEFAEVLDIHIFSLEPRKKY